MPICGEGLWLGKLNRKVGAFTVERPAFPDRSASEAGPVGVREEPDRKASVEVSSRSDNPLWRTIPGPSRELNEPAVEKEEWRCILQ